MMDPDLGFFCCYGCGWSGTGAELETSDSGDPCCPECDGEDGHLLEENVG